ncbi:MAG TPA: hypothetical protein VHO70_06215, partial [Chitinispirillaceae bacterium]|nr:hypothetical protein [Chitinispirillaceae bacterium]
MLHTQKTTFGGLTPQRVPEAYIRAEVVSLPLASEDAFNMAITELHPSLDNTTKEGKNTRDLWRRCEELLSEHASGWSLDRLIAIRDYYWFDTKADPYCRENAVPLHEYLRSIVSKYLLNRPGVTEVVKNENFFDATAHYRWLAFALPEDFLLMSSRVNPPPTFVDIDPPFFTRFLLDSGVSEIHQHIGASMDFKTFWLSTLTALASPALDPDSIKDTEVPFKKSETFFRWLLAAAIARSVLMEYLLSYSTSKSIKDFVLHLQQIKGQQWHTLEKTLFALVHGDTDVLPNFYALRNLYQMVHPKGYELCNNPPETLNEAWSQCDPIAVRLSLKSPNEGEVRFVRKCL